jgi:hypothetical protein
MKELRRCLLITFDNGAAKQFIAEAGILGVAAQQVLLRFERTALGHLFGCERAQFRFFVHAAMS